MSRVKARGGSSDGVGGVESARAVSPRLPADRPARARERVAVPSGRDCRGDSILRGCEWAAVSFRRGHSMVRLSPYWYALSRGTEAAPQSPQRPPLRRGLAALAIVNSHLRQALPAAIAAVAAKQGCCSPFTGRAAVGHIQGQSISQPLISSQRHLRRRT